MNITDYITSKTNKLVKQPEITPGSHNFEMFNDAGTEVEVSEFLYSLVRILKPDLILETGTHIGVSAAYMGQALHDNRNGMIMTFEIIPQHAKAAVELMKDLEIQSHVQCWLLDAQKYPCDREDYPIKTSGGIDLLFLDSEPQLRFDEFNKFWPYVKPGGFILIHDLHPHLGYSGETHHDVFCWPFGDFTKKIGKYIKFYDVQTTCFPTPRGLIMFQKKRDNFGATNYLLGNLNE